MKSSLVIGDWSKDGHNQSEFVYFEHNKTEEEIKNAYLKACKKIGVQLHDHKKNSILSDYEESSISKEIYDKLVNSGVNMEAIELDDPCEDEYAFNSDSVALLFLEMVKVTLPDFEYKITEQEKPINGFWSDGFNHSIGYGVFY